MASSLPDFATYCAELLSSAGTVRCKRMFGGYGLYLDEVFVAIIAGETLYLKTDAQTQGEFERAGGQRFEYTARGKTHALGFWSVPADAMDSPRSMQPWAKLALEAALRVGALKRAQASRGRRR